MQNAVVITDRDVNQNSPDEDGLEDLELPDTPLSEPPRAPLVELDISGDIDVPMPVLAAGDRCEYCALHTSRLWQSARAGNSEPHAVCTLCYLTGHMDSPTSAHGRLAYLPELSMADAIHLQRRALLAMIGGDSDQQKQGKRVWGWMEKHSREVEVAWGTARAGEFAAAMKRLPPSKLAHLRDRLTGCVLMLPADMFDDLSLLLPEGKTVQSVLSSHSWATYTRSDLYV